MKLILIYLLFTISVNLFADTKGENNLVDGYGEKNNFFSYKTRINSSKENFIEMENKAVVQVSAYLGYLGYKKNAVLFVNKKKCKIWIEGKKTYDCNIIKQPKVEADKIRKVNISKVMGKRGFLMLDGRVYEVSSVDKVHTSLWFGSSKGVIINESILINLKYDKSVNVNKV